MSSLNILVSACQAEPTELLQQIRERIALWENWLQPISDECPVGEDPGYNDDFQQMREEVNKLSGANTELICQLTEKLLTATTKDIRVATCYCWAKLQREGERGLADGLELLGGLLERFGPRLHPQRERSRKAALEWLAGSRVTDTLSLYPEVVRQEAQRTTGALLLIASYTEAEPDEARPNLIGLYSALESRLTKAGGLDAVVPQNASDSVTAAHNDAPEMSRITSGQDLLAQARTLAAYLREQPEGWLAAHHMMKSLRHDTLHSIPAPDSTGCTRIEPPRADQRALLKRLYLQQSWREILEQADSVFSRGANHLWLDLQWYSHQALLKLGENTLADIIVADLKGLLTRLSGLESLAFSDGTPFADEVTLDWIQQHILATVGDWDEKPEPAQAEEDILALEPEAVALADSEGVEAALGWLQSRPGSNSARQKWLLRLLMARLADQFGKNDLAACLLAGLGEQAGELTLAQWEPGLLFEVQARHLKLLRIKAGRSEADKTRLTPLMEQLLAALIAIDPARAAVLCG